MHRLAQMETASPDLKKQDFFVVVFLNREYSVQLETAPKNKYDDRNRKKIFGYF
jgi:hypothetical protein